MPHLEAPSSLTLTQLLSLPQIKTDLIRQREAGLLIPAAGPDASEILRLLRPAVSNPPQSETAAVAKRLATSLNPSISAIPTIRSSSALTAANEAAPTADAEAKRAAAAAGLLGLSCTISASGEVL